MEQIRGSGIWTPAADPLPPTLGRSVCRWIERHLVHGEGDYLGEPFRLEGWQRELIYRLYEYDAARLQRIVRRPLLVTPKGCGKTELCAALALAELAGPTVPTADGRGQVRKSPNVPIAAGSFEQADRLFGAARLMVTEGPLRSVLEASTPRFWFEAGQVVAIAWRCSRGQRGQSADGVRGRRGA